MVQRPGYVGPLLLMAAGFILLFNELGSLQWDTWGSLWRYWPVILILFGMEIIARHTGSDVMYFAIIFLSIILIIATVFLAWSGYPAQDRTEKDLIGTILSNRNLEGKDFNFADLDNANFSNSSLNGANMNFADLKYAKLDNTEMKGANLNFADLKYADLSYAVLDGANLNFANLDGANMTGARLDDANHVFAGTSRSTICPDSKKGPCW